MRRQIPNSQELEEALEALIGTVGPEDRQFWLTQPLTKATFLFFEYARMLALESAEDGPEPHKLTQFMAQAQLAKEVTEGLRNRIMEPLEDED